MQNTEARNSKKNETKIWIQWTDELVSEVDLLIISNIYYVSTVCR